MEALARSLVAENPKLRPQDVCAELLSILDAYPGGLTLAGRRHDGGSKRRRQQQQQQEAGGGDAAGAAGGRDQRRPAPWWPRPGLRAVPLAEALADGRPRARAIVHAEIAAAGSAAHAGAGAAALPALGAPVLHLTDGSTPQPTAMFAHSAHAPLLGGRLFEAGVRLRAAVPVAPALPGCPALPRLMPTAHIVCELPASSWAALGELGGPPGQAECAAPVLGLAEALAAERPAPNAAAAAGGSGPTAVAGWLLARVAHVGPAEDGAAWGVRAVRAVHLTHAGSGSSSGGGGGGGGGGAEAGAAAPLVLRDDEAALADLLLPGETVALWRALLQPLEGGGACAAVLLGEGALVAAPAEPEHEGQQRRQQQQEQQQEQQSTQAQTQARGCVLPPLPSLVPGEEGLVLWGRAGGLALRGGRQLAGTLAPMGAEGGAVPLRLQLGPRSKALLRVLRDGHVLLLIGARTVAADGQPGGGGSGAGVAVAVEWDEATPGAAAHDLSCLPALLTTPALQAGLLQPLPPSAAAPPTPPRGGWSLLEGRIAAAQARPARVHSACGRAVGRASFGLGCLDDFEDGSGGDGAPGGAAGGDSAAAAEAEEEEAGAEDAIGAEGALWACGFCGVECGGAETELAWTGSLALAPAGDGGGDGSGEGAGPTLTLAAEPGAWRALLPFGADQAGRMPRGAVAAEVRRAAVGHACRVCVCDRRGGDGGGGDGGGGDGGGGDGGGGDGGGAAALLATQLRLL
ncbi:hypothetical protein Rsub_05103 [Raphidocelis subcapitata]|uniref:Uncharacterized protein n=1 Tax=Raphidocelis subcapitata TaxID=307507 RepID=A0A2V0NYM6_9CHLO|nr:hypothetical protein Rsub_05103 [Raphidocelis subcapitata]|eukprot:GBF92734.1 hypothetical protein Rsub_05103 [Raphidocelis subcapitata]